MPMEPLGEWFVEFGAAISQLERDPPNIRDVNDNLWEERWTNFSLDGVKFPSHTIDGVKQGDVFVHFEQELVIHFQQISKAALPRHFWEE